MNPKPLVRVLTDHIFKKDVEGAGVLYDVTGRIAGCDQMDRRVEAKVVFTRGCVPDHEAGNDRRARAESERGDSRGCGCRDAEEIHENAFIARGVLIDEDSDGFIVAQGFQKIAGGMSLVDWRVSGESPICFDELFHPGVVYFSHDKLHRIAVKGVREAAKLPRAEVRRQKNDTLP
jgi:hypothetical protein